MIERTKSELTLPAKGQPLSELYQAGRHLGRRALGVSAMLAVTLAAGCGSVGSNKSRQPSSPASSIPQPHNPGKSTGKRQLVNSSTGNFNLAPAFNTSSLCSPQLQKLVSTLIGPIDSSSSFNCTPAGVNHPPDQYVVEYDDSAYQYLVAVINESSYGKGGNAKMDALYQSQPKFYSATQSIAGNLTYFDALADEIFVSVGPSWEVQIGNFSIVANGSPDLALAAKEEPAYAQIARTIVSRAFGK